MRIAVFVSGGGTNLQAVLDAQKDKYLSSETVLVVSNNEKAFGLERARAFGIHTLVSKDDVEILEECQKYNVDIIVLAGYLRKVGTVILEGYKDRIINIHPSLLPAHGGPGMYGIHVHEDVWENKEKTSGATVHFVTDVIDGGKILLQEEISVSECESPEEIAQKVLIVEHRLLPRALKKLEDEGI